MPPLQPGDGQDLLARFKRSWEQRDVDLAMALFRADAELRVDPFEPALVGSEAIRRHWNEVAASQANVEFDAERVWVAGNTVLASSHAAVTLRRTGERVRQRSFMTFELDDAGAVARLKEWVVSRRVGIDSTFRPEPETVLGAGLGG